MEDSEEEDYERPPFVGSGAPRRPRLPKFPNNTDLVVDKGNTKVIFCLLS